jgi:hypothetical protein
VSSLDGLGSEELRAAVRAVLREVLPTGVVGTPAAAEPVPPMGGEVVVATDADLGALVSRVAALCDDPAQRAALREGRHGFRLAGGGPRSSAGTSGGATAGVVRVERGAVTERTVLHAAAEKARLVVGRRAVLTPLARDRARVLGVEIEKER